MAGERSDKVFITRTQNPVRFPSPAQPSQSPLWKGKTELISTLPPEGYTSVLSLRRQRIKERDKWCGTDFIVSQA